MKRFFFVILILLTVFHLFVLPAFAADGDDNSPEQTETLYKEKLVRYICDTWNKNTTDVENQLLYYDEPVIHMDEQDQADWALIHAYSNAIPSNIKYGVNIGSRSIYVMGGCGMFPVSGYSIYDVKNDLFFDLGEYERFEGLDDIVEELGLGNPLGDADFDGTITVVDATRIQKILAGIIHSDPDMADSDIVYDSVLQSDRVYYLSDYDCDGVRSILDATHIQRHLASMDESGSQLFER